MAYKPNQESMSDNQKQVFPETHHPQISGKTLLLASLAGIAVGGPLLGMMGFSLLATLTLLVIISPLLLIFSPLLIFAAFVTISVMVGFAVAAAMAYAGLSTLAWIFREVRGRQDVGLFGERVKGGKGVDGYMQGFSTTDGVYHG